MRKELPLALKKKRESRIVRVETGLIPFARGLGIDISKTIEDALHNAIKQTNVKNKSGGD